MKEYVEIIRLALSGKQINYDGDIFKLNNFTLLIKPQRNEIPIYVAAINQKNGRFSLEYWRWSDFLS